MDDSGSTDQTTNSPEVKCDFCDITLKSDIDVSKHLNSINHAKNKSKLLALMDPQDKVAERQIPENFNQMLQLLKVRNAQDLKRMNDRNFFKIKNETDAIVAEEIAKELLWTSLVFDAEGTPLGKKLVEIRQGLKLDQANDVNSASGSDSQTNIGPAEIKRRKILERQRKINLEAKQRADEERRLAEEDKRKEENKKKEEQRLKIIKQREEEERRKRREEEERKKQKRILEEKQKQPAPSMDFSKYQIELATIKVKTEPKGDNES